MPRSSYGTGLCCPQSCAQVALSWYFFEGEPGVAILHVLAASSHSYCVLQ